MRREASSMKASNWGFFTLPSASAMAREPSWKSACQSACTRVTSKLRRSRGSNAWASPRFFLRRCLTIACWRMCRATVAGLGTSPSVASCFASATKFWWCSAYVQLGWARYWAASASRSGSPSDGRVPACEGTLRASASIGSFGAFFAA
jgi:hypothetical protein